MKKLLAIILSVAMVFSLFAFTESVAIADNSNGINNTGNTYYVDADNGNDANTGLSESSAWQSLEKVNSTTFEPGDAVLLKRGCIWTDTFLWPKGTGDAQNQNYISCYGDEQDDLPRIISTYSDEMSGLPSSDTCLSLENNQNYWTIQKLNLTNGTNGSGSQSVARVKSSSSNKIQGVIIKDCVINGSNPDNWSNSSRSGLAGIAVDGLISSILIENNEVYNCKATGITVNGGQCGVNYKGQPNLNAGQGIVVRNNYLENIGKDGVLINNAYEPLVEYNVVNKSHSYATSTAHVAFWPFASYGSLFQYNEAYNTRTIYDGQGFDCDYLCYNTTFQYNYSHDNVGGFMLICTEASASWMNPQYAYNVGSTVRYNISQNDHHYAFNLTDGVQDTRIYNNTIYGSRNSNNATNLFFAYDKGKNMLTGLHYADNLLIANNIFYLDTFTNVGLSKCTNVTWNNNIICGIARNAGPANGTVNLVTDDSANSQYDSDGNQRYYYKQVSGNLYNTDPMMVDPGKGGIGRETCNGYQLYADSPCIGTGVAIEDGYHDCPNDYFGNAINNKSVNIGAYAGTGVKRTKATVFDSKYSPVLDFENETVGQNGTGTVNVSMSGITQCTAYEKIAQITDLQSVQNTNTESTKCLELSNNTESTATASAKFYVYKSTFAKSNGVRIWLDPNGKKTNFTVYFVIDSKSYSKSFSVKEAGWRILTFNEIYTGSNNARVTPTLMREITEFKIAASLEAGQSVYVDDLQTNNGTMDEVVTTVINNEPATTTLVENFETESERNFGGSGTYGGPSSGPNAGSGIATYNNSKAFYAKSSSGSCTGVKNYFNWSTAFQKLQAAITADTEAQGIQLDMPATGSYSVLSSYTQSDISPNGKMALINPTVTGQNVIFTISNVKAGTYTLSTTSRDDINRGIYDIYVNDILVKADESFVSSSSSVEFNTHNLGQFIITQDADVTVKFVCKQLGSLYLMDFVVQDQSNNSTSYNAYNDCSPKSDLIYMNDEEKYKCSNQWNKYTVTLDSSNVISYTTVSGASATVKSFKCSVSADQNNIARIPFNKLYFTYTENSKTYTMYLTDFESEQVINWKKGISCITNSYTTCGAIIGRNVTTTVYYDNISLYKDVQHEISDWRVVNDATCTQDGERQRVCEYCDEVLETQVIPATGHTPSDWEIVTTPTCTTDGLKQIICEKCGEALQSDVLPATGHDLSTVVMPAKCTQEGYTYQMCSKCNYESEHTDIVAALGHRHTEWVVDVAATCTVEGQAHKVCNDCSETLVTGYIMPIGHDYEWTLTIAPTCTESGTRVAKCTHCGDVQSTEVVAALGHKTTVKNKKLATYFNTGYTGDMVCTRCNKVVAKGKEIAKLKLKKPVIKVTPGKKQLKVSYKKVTGATKYEIMILTNRKWKKYVSKSTTYTIKKLNKGTKYKVKVRAVAVLGKKVANSSFSTIVTKKAK